MAPPSARVASPEYHQGRTDHRLLSAPIRKDIRPVTTQEVQKAPFKAATNGIRGTSPQRRKAENVKIDARQGERTASGRPYSSRSMMRTQRLRSAVIARQPGRASRQESPVSAESRVPRRVRPLAGDGLCFALESLAQLGAICEMRWQNFYGDDAIKACVAGFINLSHTAGTYGG